MDTIRWGIIGCGDVTEVKSGPAFNKIEGSQLVAVMRRNTMKARDYANRHNVPRWYSNADELINDQEIDAVYIATPPGSHAEYATKVMMAGKPVYVEKPMATNYNDCLKMLQTSKETGIPLFVAYYRRLLPGFVKVKEMIDAGEIGRPLIFHIRFFTPPREDDRQNPLPWRLTPELSGGGYIYDLGSHQLDFIDYLLGPLNGTVSLTANQAGLYPPEDFISAGFKGQGNICGNGLWSFAAPEHCREDSIEIIGEKGSIIFSCFNFTPTLLIKNGQTTQIDNPRPMHVQQPLIESIVNELRGKGKCPSTGESAARTSKILDAIAHKTTLKSS
jgi:predicted dehydrogenase